MLDHLRKLSAANLRLIQTRLTPAPVHSLGARTYSYQNQDVPRSGARPVGSRPAHNSLRAGSATSWRPTPPAPTGRPQKLLCSSYSSVASSDDDAGCQNSNPDSGKTRCVACHCSQTRPPTAELPRGYVAWALTTLFLRSSATSTQTPPVEPVCWSDAYDSGLGFRRVDLRRSIALIEVGMGTRIIVVHPDQSSKSGEHFVP